MIWNKRKKINIQPEQNEETRIQNNGERLRNLWDNFKHFNIRIIRVPEEEEEQEIGNLFENINEGILPQSGKGNRLSGNPGSSESPKKVGPEEENIKACLLYTSPSPRD